MTTFSNFPIMLQTNKSSNTVIQNGNLYMPGASYDSTGIGSVGVSSGKWYYELRVGHNYGSYFVFGWVCANIDDTYLTEISSSQTGSLNWSQLGTVITNGSAIAPDPSVPSYYNTNTKIVGTYLDLDNNKVYWHGDNNFLQESDGTARTPTAGNGFDIPAALQGQIFYPMVGTNKTGAPSNTHVNFGQDSSFQGETTGQNNTDSNGFGDFYYAPSTGYLSMCSANMPTSSDIDPGETDSDYPGKQVFISQYAGNGTNRTITTEAQPDLIIIRTYDNAQDWYLLDSSRGITANKYSLMNKTDAEATLPQSNFTSVGSTSVGISNGTYLNSTGANYQMWMWKCNGGTTASNTDGATTTTVQVNTKAGFSIVEWPQYTPNSTFGHGLSKAPTFIISKLTGLANWAIYHSELDSGKVLYFTSAAQFTSSIYNSTAPTSSVFSLGASYAGSGAGISYCWHEVEGYSKFGTYEGTGTTDGPYIMTNMRPRIIIIKRSDGTSGWTIIDTARYTNNNPNGPGRLELNTNTAEITGSSATREMDLYANGFKLKSTNSNINNNGSSYIYACWGDQPSKYSNAR